MANILKISLHLLVEGTKEKESHPKARREEENRLYIGSLTQGRSIHGGDREGEGPQASTHTEN